MDAHRVGSAGEKQHGIDILATMENRASWVVQCKRMKKFGKSDAERAIKKAEAEFGHQHPAHYLFWVTSEVKTDAILLHQLPKLTKDKSSMKLECGAE